MGKVAEKIANLIRDEELTTGEIDYLMAILNTKRHRAPYRDDHLSERAKRTKRTDDGFPSSHNLISEVLKNH